MAGDDIPSDAQTSASDFAKAQAREKEALARGIAGLNPNNGQPWKRSELRAMTQPEFQANQASILVAVKNGSIQDDLKRPPNTRPTAGGMRVGRAGAEHSPELQQPRSDAPTQDTAGLPHTDLDGNQI